MGTKLRSIPCKLPTMTTHQLWCYMKHFVARSSIMTTYQLNALIKLAIMIVKLPSVTYEVSFNELFFLSGNFGPTERQLVYYNTQLLVRLCILATYHPDVF